MPPARRRLARAVRRLAGLREREAEEEEEADEGGEREGVAQFQHRKLGGTKKKRVVTSSASSATNFS